MKIQDILSEIEVWAPLALQETYDNAGLIVGDSQNNCTGVLICLDSTEEIIDEALSKNCNLIIAHHPIVFGGLKKFTGENYIERTVIKAIKNDVSIYAVHTNLDNVYTGVNAKIAEKIGLKNTKILDPKSNQLSKLIVFCPKDSAEELRKVLFEAGAGEIGNYDSCSFNTSGVGTFKANKGSQPYVGNVGELYKEEEVRMECVVYNHLKSRVVKSMLAAHPYEEVAYDLIPLSNKSSQIGAGMIGELENEMDAKEFLLQLKKSMDLEVLKHTELCREKIGKVAICGGSGSFLLNDAIGSKADVFISGDFKYHQYFDADSKIIIADIGHYESEIYTIELIFDKLNEKFSNFALHLAQANTNPIKYL